MTKPQRNLLIIGAGFSQAVTKGKFPLDKNFFIKKSLEVWESYDFLREAMCFLFGRDETLYYGQRVCLSLSSFQEMCQTLSLEEVWDNIMYRLTYPQPFPIEKDSVLIQKLEDIWTQRIDKERDIPKKFFTWFKYRNRRPTRNITFLFLFARFELIKLILATYGDYIRDKNLAQNFSMKIGLPSLLSNGGKLDVISYNWDTLFETLLQELNIKYSYQGDTFSHYNVAIRILKPHGSLNWIRELASEKNATGRILDYGEDTIHRDDP